MSNKITIIGETSSGKKVYSSFAHPEHKLFSASDYVDAGELMEDINPGIAKAYYKAAEKALEMETLIQQQGILEKAEFSEKKSSKVEKGDEEESDEMEKDETTEELIPEHKKLVKVLNSGNKKKLKQEAGEQEEELEEYEEEEKDKLKKAGEGSRGGKVIGHTKSGKPVYQLTDKVRIKKTGHEGEIHKYGKGDNLIVRCFDKKSGAHIHTEHSPDELEKVDENKTDKLQKADMIEHIETGQQFLDWIQKSDVILTEDAYDLLSVGKSIETGFWGDLSKAKDLSDLHKVKKLITRGGKTFLATFYESNGDSEEILGEHHELPAGTPSHFKHGDDVEYEHHGKKVVGKIQKFIFHPTFSKHGSVVVKDQYGKKYTKSLRNIKSAPGVPEGNKQAARPEHDKTGDKIKTVKGLNETSKKYKDDLFKKTGLEIGKTYEVIAYSNSDLKKYRRIHQLIPNTSNDKEENPYIISYREADSANGFFLVSGHQTVKGFSDQVALAASKGASVPAGNQTASTEIPYSVHAAKVKQMNKEVRRAEDEKYGVNKRGFESAAETAKKQSGVPAGNQTASTSPNLKNPEDMGYDEIMKEVNATFKAAKTDKSIDLMKDKRFNEVTKEMTKREKIMTDFVRSGEAMRKRLLGGK